jgi:hypothetical protein
LREMKKEAILTGKRDFAVSSPEGGFHARVYRFSSICANPV